MSIDILRRMGASTPDLTVQICLGIKQLNDRQRYFPCLERVPSAAICTKDSEVDGERLDVRGRRYPGAGRLRTLKMRIIEIKT